MKKLLAVLLVLMLATTVLGGCGQSNEPNQDAGAGTEGDADQEGQASDYQEKNQVALVLAGPINDMGWNASAFNGLEMIRENYYVDVSLSENVAQSDAEEVIRNYGVMGYDLIFIHGSEFQDATLNVAGDFPESMYVIINGIETNDINIADVQVSDGEQGFVMGVIAALMSETGTVGVLGGEKIPPIFDAVESFEVGAKYIDPEIEVLSTMTGSFSDVNGAKETTLAQIDEGADVIASIANQATLGSLEAAEDKGIYAIGAGEDQAALAPDTIIVSVLKTIPIAFEYSYEMFIKGELTPDIHRLGVDAGVISLSPYYEFEDKVPEEVKDKINEVLAKLSAGEIDITKQD